MIEITLSKVTDFLEVETLWRDLESRSDASFFQSWGWTGCLATERFPKPVLLKAREQDRVVALGLFNASPSVSTLWLGESGNSKHDDVFIEHNGFLIEAGRSDVIASCIEIARIAPIGLNPGLRGTRLVRFSGVSDEYLKAARVNHTQVKVCATGDAPFIDFDALRRTNRAYISVPSRNTRYQIRRSERAYAAIGPLSITRARTEQEAQELLTALAQFHQAYWISRGQPGAFANPQFANFHRALIARTFSAGEADLLRVTAGGTVIGYLYNFVFKGRVFSYQSGFNYQLSSTHQKPGLTCHHLAIEMYFSEGAHVYDFLAGLDRYKLSLATNITTLNWLEYGRQGIWRTIRRKIQGYFGQYGA